MSGFPLGRYEVVAHIATGSIAEVFLAHPVAVPDAGVPCVVKRFLPAVAGSGPFRAMLAEHARIAACFAHPNICRVHALDGHDHELYLVTDYLEGATLLQLLHAASRMRHKLAHGLIAGVVQQACDGLHYAHELRGPSGQPLGLVHGDVTPSNLFLTEHGVVQLLDFGIARIREAAAAEPGEVNVKYTYMAPEQLRGHVIGERRRSPTGDLDGAAGFLRVERTLERTADRSVDRSADRSAVRGVDRRADVFSLAVVVCEMLTCRRLVQSRTDSITSSALMTQLLADLRQHRLDAPDGVVGVLRRALDRDPSARYATVRDFGSALTHALGVPRPWTAADIGELVRSEFARDIGFRTAEVAKMRKRARRESASVLAMLGRLDGDSSVDMLTQTGMGARPARSSEVRVLDSHAGLLPAGPGQARIPRAHPSSQPAPLSHAAVPVALRSRLPAMVLGGAATMVALGAVLLWRAPERADRGGPASTAAASVASSSAPSSSAAASSIAGTASQPAPPEPYGAAIQRRAHELDQCVRDHAESLPPATTAALVVDTDGHARDIALRPDGADHSALGACIRAVLQVVSFPPADDEKQITLGLAIGR